MKKDKGSRVGGQDEYVACDNCALDDVCRPIAIGGSTLPLVHDIMGRREPVSAGDFLYRKGEPLTAIYAVTSGTIKVQQTTDAGRAQVLGFRFPGELFGEEAIYPSEYSLDALAVDDASVCRIPMQEFDELAEKIPLFQKKLIKLIGRQCYVAQRQLAACVARNSAEERLSAFMLNVAERNSIHYQPGNEIQLAMSRDDIANFLGLRRETLSRTLTKLQKSGLISVRGKVVEILDIKELRLLAHYL